MSELKLSDLPPSFTYTQEEVSWSSKGMEQRPDDLKALLDHFDSERQSVELTKLDDYYFPENTVMVLYGPRNKSREQILSLDKARFSKFDYYDVAMLGDAYYLFVTLESGSDGSTNQPPSYWQRYWSQVGERAEYMYEEVSEALGSPSEIVNGLQDVGKKAIYIAVGVAVLGYMAPIIIKSFTK